MGQTDEERFQYLEQQVLLIKQQYEHIEGKLDKLIAAEERQNQQFVSREVYEIGISQIKKDVDHIGDKIRCKFERSDSNRDKWLFWAITTLIALSIVGDKLIKGLF